MPVATSVVEILDHCVGDRWTVTDEDELARLVAIVLMGQAIHAQNIILGIPSNPPKFDAAQEQEIRQDTINALTLDSTLTGKAATTQISHRDGILFEAISWIVARRSHPEAVMRDPHISPTTQGLDGIMIELTADKENVIRTIVFEDKCVEDPAYTFSYKTLPALKRIHINSRSVLQSANAILLTAMTSDKSAEIAVKAIKMDVRGYRASFPITPTLDDVPGRSSIFKKYDEIAGLLKERRIGSTLVTSNDMRDWFEQFSKIVIGKI